MTRMIRTRTTQATADRVLWLGIDFILSFSHHTAGGGAGAPAFGGGGGAAMLIHFPFRFSLLPPFANRDQKLA